MQLVVEFACLILVVEVAWDDIFWIHLKIIKKLKQISLLVLSLSCCVVGCNSLSQDSSSLARGTHQAIASQNESLFREVALDFVRLTKKRDVEGMMSLTSWHTINNTGRERVRYIYENQIVPSFFGSDFKVKVASKVIYDEYGGAGFTYRGKMKNGYYLLDVFAENDSIKVARIYKETNL